MADETTQREARWRERLSPEQYAVTRQGATERAFTGAFWDHHEDCLLYTSPSPRDRS